MRTNVGAEIRRGEHAHAQILVDLSNDFDSIVEIKVGILRFESAHGAKEAQPDEAETYPVQVEVDAAVGVDGGLFAAQLRHLAEDADGLVGELLEQRRVDAGSLVGHVGCEFWDVAWSWLRRDRVGGQAAERVAASRVGDARAHVRRTSWPK